MSWAVIVTAIVSVLVGYGVGYREGFGNGYKQGLVDADVMFKIILRDVRERAGLL